MEGHKRPLDIPKVGGRCPKTEQVGWFSRWKYLTSLATWDLQGKERTNSRKLGSACAPVVPMLLGHPRSCGTHAPVAPTLLWRPRSCGTRTSVTPVPLWHPHSCGADAPVAPVPRVTHAPRAPVLLGHPRSWDTHAPGAPALLGHPYPCGTHAPGAPTFLGHPPSYGPVPLWPRTLVVPTLLWHPHTLIHIHISYTHNNKNHNKA